MATDEYGHSPIERRAGIINRVSDMLEIETNADALSANRIAKVLLAEVERAYAAPVAALNNEGEHWPAYRLVELCNSMRQAREGDYCPTCGVGILSDTHAIEIRSGRLIGYCSRCRENVYLVGKHEVKLAQEPGGPLPLGTLEETATNEVAAIIVEKTELRGFKSRSLAVEVIRAVERAYALLYRLQIETGSPYCIGYHYSHELVVAPNGEGYSYYAVQIEGEAQPRALFTEYGAAELYIDPHAQDLLKVSIAPTRVAFIVNPPNQLVGIIGRPSRATAVPTDRYTGEPVDEVRDFVDALLEEPRAGGCVLVFPAGDGAPRDVTDLVRSWLVPIEPEE